MKLQISFKDPNAVSEMIIRTLEKEFNLEETSYKDLLKFYDTDEYIDRENQLTEVISHFIRYQEYVKIEIDSETLESRVVPINEY